MYTCGYCQPIEWSYFVLAWILNTSESIIELNTPNVFSYHALSPASINTRSQHWLTFQVKSSNDVHIGLQTYYNSTDIMYELVIGGWGNTKSGIRRVTQGTLLDVHTGSLLNSHELQPFWVSWGGGVVRVGTGTHVGSQQVLSLVDPAPYLVHYVAVSTGFGGTGQWIIEGVESDHNKFGLFHIELPHALYNPDLRMLNQTEEHLTSVDCAHACFHLLWCRGFSYSASQQQCRMFDTAPPSHLVAVHTHWHTWTITGHD